jgi:hypothetical protein
LTKSLIAYEQPLLDFEAITNVNKRLALALFGALAVADVNGGDLVIPGRKGSTHG